jgi:hypothetical protein
MEDDVRREIELEREMEMEEMERRSKEGNRVEGEGRGTYDGADGGDGGSNGDDDHTLTCATTKNVSSPSSVARSQAPTRASSRNGMAQKCWASTSTSMTYGLVRYTPQPSRGGAVPCRSHHVAGLCRAAGITWRGCAVPQASRSAVLPGSLVCCYTPQPSRGGAVPCRRHRAVRCSAWVAIVCC